MSTAPDTTAYRAVHRALRVAPRRLAAGARSIGGGDRRRVAAVAKYWRGYQGETLCHHTIEDDIVFPALLRRVPEAAGLLDQTDEDHHELDRLMAACTAAVDGLDPWGEVAQLHELADRLDRLADLMDRHLDLEDAEIIPLVETWFTADEFEQLEQQANKAIGLGKQAFFTIPFIVGEMPDDERKRLMADAPLPLRLLYRLVRLPHARLAALALRPVPDRVPEPVAVPV